MIVRLEFDATPYRLVGLYPHDGELTIKAVMVQPGQIEVLEMQDEPAPLAPADWSRARWGTVEALAHLFNESVTENIPAVETLSDGRRKKARGALKKFPHKSWWAETFAEYHRSKFLSGNARRAEGHSWVADFDKILANGRMGVEIAVRIHDGYYRD
jgi:hypothetical protein